MSAQDQFSVRVFVRYQGDGTIHKLRVKVELTNQGENTPFATLEDEATPLSKSAAIDFPFCLPCLNVSRFREHVDVEVVAVALETWSDPTETLTGDDEKVGRILLPVVTTHGITGDWANLSILGWQPGYKTVGPGLPEMAAALAEDGYKLGGSYPTVYILVYPSLNPNGNAWLAENYMAKEVNKALSTSYADRVDIVAHSMGGLISRYYIEVMGGEEKVRKLIMIGTPNEGAAGAHIALEEDALGIGVAELAPSALTLTAVANLLGQDLGVTTNVELLSAYPYFCEFPRV